MNEFIFVGITAYLYIAGGYILVAVMNPPLKARTMLFWPFIPLYVLGGLFFASQEHVDQTIDEHEDNSV